MPAAIIEVDPFDLPDWLGDSDVVWQADAGVRSGHLVPGRLTTGGHDDLACDLLAADEAYPEPVTDDATRLRVHLAWRHGQVLVCERDGRLTLAFPGSRLGPELALEAIGRLARSVGADPERFAVLLRIGAG